MAANAQAVSPAPALLEVVDRDGLVRQSWRIERWPVTIGRALDNTIVLSDPHVAAHHATTKTRTCQPKWLCRVNVFDNSAQRPHQIAPPEIVDNWTVPMLRTSASGSVSTHTDASTTASTAAAKPSVGGQRCSVLATALIGCSAASA